MSVDKVIELVNWPLLNKQRLALVEIANFCARADVLADEEYEHLDGIINLLNELCDAKGVSDGTGLSDSK